MGHVTTDTPKSLLRVQDKSIIWYIILSLYKEGFRKFFLPLGYKGDMIENIIKLSKKYFVITRAQD